MSNMLRKLMVLATVMLTFGFYSCKNESDTEGNGATSIVKISDVNATFNSVSFSASAEGAIALAYYVTSEDETPSGEDVFEKGQASGTPEGNFTVGDLKSETDYTVFVAARLATGFSGAQSAKFKTLENKGEPASPNHAGIRIVEVEENDFVWEVANGDSIDFSLSYVVPTVIAENDIYEQSKRGVTEDQYIKSIILTYGYLVKPTIGGGKVEQKTYTELYATDNVIPGAGYTIYTLGLDGDYDEQDATEWTAKEISRVDLTTKGYELQGSPAVDVKLTRKGYTYVEHSLTPNADATYFATFFTKTKEIDEFIKMWDDNEGPGAGEARLREFVRMWNTYELTNQYQAENRRIDVGYGEDSVNYTRLALGLDDNFMPGTTLGRSDDHCLPVDSTQEPATFHIEASKIGATSLYVDAMLDPNCYRVYWRIDAAGTCGGMIADPEKREQLKWDIWNGGYVFYRKDGENKNRDTEMVESVLHHTTMPGMKYEITAIAVNYFGGITDPEIVTTFETKSRTLSDYESPLEIDITVSKTIATARYYIPESKLADAANHRMLFHRIIEKNADDETYGPVLDYDAQKLQEWLTACAPASYGGSSYAWANDWPIWNGDKQLGDEYDYTWNWAAMNAGTTYQYLYVTENLAGEVSAPVRKEFTTATNDGGPNPEMNIEIDEESFYLHDNDHSLYSFTGKYLPNADVTSYNYLYIGSKPLESWGYDINDPESLHKGLYNLLLSDGMQAVDNVTLDAAANSFSVADESHIFAVSLADGAAGIKSKLTYVEIKAKNGKLESLGDIQRVDIPAATRAAFAAKSYGIPYAPQPITKVASKASDREVPASIFPYVSTSVNDAAPVLEPSVAEADDHVGIYEFSHQVMTGQY